MSLCTYRDAKALQEKQAKKAAGAAGGSGDAGGKSTKKWWNYNNILTGFVNFMNLLFNTLMWWKSKDEGVLCVWFRLSFNILNFNSGNHLVIIVCFSDIFVICCYEYEFAVNIWIKLWGIMSR